MVVVFGLEGGTFKDSDDLAAQLRSLISGSTIDQFCVEVRMHTLPEYTSPLFAGINLFCFFIASTVKLLYT